jgi:hypothetical protein
VTTLLLAARTSSPCVRTSSAPASSSPSARPLHAAAVAHLRKRIAESLGDSDRIADAEMKERLERLARTEHRIRGLVTSELARLCAASSRADASCSRPVTTASTSPRGPSSRSSRSQKRRSPRLQAEG